MFSEMALSVIKTRYLRKDPITNELLETPDGMLHRVADALGNEDYYHLMASLDFLPNTPTLVNAGRPNGQLAACFVLPIEDSMDGIFNSLHDAAMIHKTGGGTGFSFSRLRSKGSPVYSTSGTSSGVVSFLHVYNEATNSVKQGGVRRGANMGILRVDHPDIEEFIMCKDDPSQVTNFNLSVGIVDGFIKAVRDDADWSLIDPAHNNVTKVLKARTLWDLIIHQAWKNGEPGVVFLDVINKYNPTPEYGEIESTNPCGEQPLLPYESCNLGSINLYNHVKDERIDYGHLGQTVRLSVDFLNSVLDHNHFPLPQIEQCTLRTRKIGLGVMGWSDALLALGMKYASPEALQLAEDVMKFINGTAWEYSRKKEYHNATCTTIAPTGTISMIANVSSGIEPNFSWVYRRKAMDKDFYVVHPLMEAELKKRKCFNDATLQLLYRGVPLKQIPGLQGIDDCWQLSHQISPEYHIRMQAAFQKYTDNAVSKTINLPNTATENDVRTAYELAYQLGCKGVTVYRDGCRADQVLNFADTSAPKPTAVRERPEETVGSTNKVKIGCGKLYVTVNADESGEPIEVFTNTGKAGGCPAQSEGLARMISLCMRYNVPTDAIIKQLKGIRCMSTIRKEGCTVLSCPDAIGRTLEKHKKGSDPADTEPTVNDTTGTQVCPDCGQPLEISEGCIICRACGYSKCG
jgi:ribonucleoside-diphosphate reductase alpha chain